MMKLMASPLTVSNYIDDIDGITFNCIKLDMMRLMASPLTVSSSRDDDIDGITFNCV